MLVVLGIIGIMAATLYPAFKNAKQKLHASTPRKNISTNVEKKEFQGLRSTTFVREYHTYLLFDTPYGGSIVHDPDCMRCRR
jgi:Tfp pilus assembly protein PilE